MTEKPPVFTVTDRRKFTLEGDLRDESGQTQAPEETAKSNPAAEPPPGPRLVTTPPSQNEPAAPEKAATEVAAVQDADTPRRSARRMKQPRITPTSNRPITLTPCSAQPIREPTHLRPSPSSS